MEPKRSCVLFAVLVTLICFLSSCKTHPRIAAEFQFDAAGNLLSSTGPDGKQTSFKRDSRGLLTEVDSPDGSAHFGYDAHGNCIWVHDDAGATEYYYDAFDKLSAVIWDRGPRRLISYRYDHTGLPSRISVFNLQPLGSDPKFSAQVARVGVSNQADSSGLHERERLVLDLAEQLRTATSGGSAPWIANDISYVRNLQGDLKEIRSEAGTVRFDRSPDGKRVERVLPNGVHSIFEYTPSQRLSRLRHSDSSGRDIASFDYSYDSDGRLLNVSGSEDGKPSRTDYEWDDRGRLKNLTTGGAEFLYRYDDQGRRLAISNSGKTVTFTFDTLGRVIHAKGVALSLTLQGTMSARRDERETTEIRYNYEGRPLEITTRSATFRYRWDGEGNLVSVTQDGKTVHLVPAAGTEIQLPLLETGDEGAPESKLLIGGSILGQIDPGGAQFYLESESSASGGAGCYSVSGHGRAADDSQRHTTAPRTPRNGPALIPARFSYHRGSARTAPASLILAQCEACQLRQPADSGWNQPLARAQGWLQGFTHIPSAQEILQTQKGWQHDIDEDANFYWNGAGPFSKGAGIIEKILSGALFDIDISLTQFYIANRNYYSSPTQKNIEALNASGWNSFINVASLISDKITGPVFKWGTKLGAKSVLDEEFQRSAFAIFKKLKPTDLEMAAAEEKGVEYVAGLNTSRIIAADLMARNGINAFVEKVVDVASDRIGHILDVAEAVMDLNKKPKGANGVAGSSGHNQLGGIQLSSVVQGDIGVISGAVYDPTSGSIVLLSDKSEAAVYGIKAEDFAVALRLAYSESPEEAAFSLDPADPKNPDGPWLQKVYYPDDLLAGTDFGKAMFEADWLLKQYSFGVVVEPGKPQRVRISSVPGYKSVADLSLEDKHHANQSASRARFWIVSGEMKIRRGGSAIVFDKASMGVKTKPLVVDPNSKTGLSDDNRAKNPINEEFAERFTEHYDELAAESPEFERVRELAKAVAIARWLRQNNVPVDLDGMRLDRVGLQSDDSDAHRLMPALSTRFKKVKQTPIHNCREEGILTSSSELYLFGGVDLKSNPQFLSDSSLGELQKTVQDNARWADAPVFQVGHAGITYTATVLPLTRPAMMQRANARSFVRDGNTYRVDSQDRIIEMVDKLGNRARYRDAAMGSAGVVEITGKVGWKAVAHPIKSGMALQLITARGNQIDVISDTSGAVQSIAVDGKLWAQYHKVGNGVSVRLDQGSFAEVISFDGKGRATGYQLERPSRQGKMGTESATVEYSAEGLPVRLKGTGLPETDWQYDVNGRLQRVWSSHGSSITVTYDEGTSTTILDARTGEEGDESANHDVAKAVFESNRLVSLESSQTGTVDFKYDNQRLIAVNSERLGETSFSYYQNGRPALVSPPSGPSYRFKFGEKPRPGAIENSEFKIQVLEPGPWRKPVPKQAQHAYLFGRPAINSEPYWETL